ncbi:Serine/threonine-protein kinase MRCK gamma, partial [Ophiophagus hannah]
MSLLKAAFGFFPGLQQVDSRGNDALHPGLGSCPSEFHRAAFTNWETQIADILKWVSNEKESRGYLQAVATRMMDEMEALKQAGAQSPGGPKSP